MIVSDNHPTVFLIENDEAVRGNCERVLSGGGYRVEKLADGGGELDAVMEARPDAVIVDLRRPCHESLILIHKIRACSRQIAIIVIAASPTVRNAVDALKAGADEVLSGPFSPDELKLAVAVALKQRRDEPC